MRGDLAGEAAISPGAQAQRLPLPPASSWPWTDAQRLQTTQTRHRQVLGAAVRRERWKTRRGRS